MLDVMRSNARSSLIVIIFGAIIVSFIFSFGLFRLPDPHPGNLGGDGQRRPRHRGRLRAGLRTALPAVLERSRRQVHHR